MLILSRVWRSLLHQWGKKEQWSPMWKYHWTGSPHFHDNNPSNVDLNFGLWSCLHVETHQVEKPVRQGGQTETEADNKDGNSGHSRPRSDSLSKQKRQHFSGAFIFQNPFFKLLSDSKAGEGRVTNIKQEGSKSKVLTRILNFNCTDNLSVQYLTEAFETLQDN